jgi:hypothetical protein
MVKCSINGLGEVVAHFALAQLQAHERDDIFIKSALILVVTSIRDAIPEMSPFTMNTRREELVL